MPAFVALARRCERAYRQHCTTSHSEADAFSAEEPAVAANNKRRSLAALGMTKRGLGMTKRGLGMTKRGLGITSKGFTRRPARLSRGVRAAPTVPPRFNTRAPTTA